MEGENLIGRDQKAVVWVDDASVSRHHARILIDESGARLEDLGSKNGTYRGGRKVEKPRPLNDGDALRLGSVAMIFRRLRGGHIDRDGSRPERSMTLAPGARLGPYEILSPSARAAWGRSTSRGTPGSRETSR